MSGFLTGLDLRLKGDRIWVLDAPLAYRSNLLKAVIVVPKGFETDLASVPRVPVVFWFWGGRAHREAVLHDYLYRTDSVPVVSFKVANRVFLEAMKSRSKGAGVCYPMYWGVVLGGKASYHKKKVDDSL